MHCNHPLLRIRNCGWRYAVVLAAALAAGPALAAETPRPLAPPVQSAQQAARNSVEEINFSASASGQFTIRVLLKRELERRPSIFASYQSAVRIVVDFVDMDSAPGRKTIAIGRYGLRSLELVPTENRTRLVILVDPPLGYTTEVIGRELLITLDRAQASAPRGDRWGSGDGE